MQIRYETMKLTMHPTNNAGTFTRVPGGCLRWPPTPPGPRWPPALNLELERERTKEEKEREVLHLFRCYTHTHRGKSPNSPDLLKRFCSCRSTGPQRREVSYETTFQKKLLLETVKHSQLAVSLSHSALELRPKPKVGALRS